MRKFTLLYYAWDKFIHFLILVQITDKTQIYRVRIICKSVKSRWLSGLLSVPLVGVLFYPVSCIVFCIFNLNYLVAQNKENAAPVSPLTDELQFSINFLQSGEIIISGSVASLISGDEGYISKQDADGNLMWSKTIGGLNNDFFQKSIEQNGSIYCGGSTNSFGQNFQDFYVVKFDGNGDTIWAKVIGGNKFDRLMEIIPDDDKLLLGGISNSFGTTNSNDILLIEIDSMANPVWAKSLEADGEEILHSVKKLPDSGFIIAGNTNSFGAGMKDVFIMKTDSVGNPQWLRCFGANQDEDAIDILENEGGIYVTGYTKSVSNAQDLWIFKTDSGGNLLWSKVIDFGLNEKGNKIFFRNGKIFVSGYMQSFTGTFDDMFILSADENGENISAKQFQIPGQQYGNFIGEVSGKISTAGFYSDSLKMKIFEMNDSLFSCISTPIAFDTFSMQIPALDTFFSVKSIPVDSLIQERGGNYSDFGNTYVNADICSLPLSNSDSGPDSYRVQIFPNPNAGKFGVRSSSSGELRIFNMFGEIVFSSPLTTGNKQLATNLSGGIYFLEITTPGFTITKKIIIQDY